MTTAAVVAASGASGAGVFGLVAMKFRWLRRRRDRSNGNSSKTEH
ncbi:MAG: hypothetical protein ACJ8OJ_21310 [Povalibacter sp.]